jgi:DNA replication initiation complex subunit (GINS family)
MEKKPIQIDSDLYKEVREFCDQNGLRLIDFVEDALAQAIAFEETLDASRKAEKIIREATDDMRQTYRRGFHLGIAAGLFAAQGKLGSSINSTPTELSYKNEPNKVVGPQLEIFD